MTFFDMGGYGMYVWSAYGVAAIVLLANLVVALRDSRKVLQDIKQ